MMAKSSRGFLFIELGVSVKEYIKISKLRCEDQRSRDKIQFKNLGKVIIEFAWLLNTSNIILPFSKMLTLAYLSSVL